MNDLISRQAVIKWVKTECNPYGNPTLDFESGKKVIEHLEQMLPAQQWIPCNEKFPEAEKKTYWICTNTGDQCECRWTNNVYGLGESGRWGWSVFDIPPYTEVVAWMPLPEPYKEETHEAD